MKPAEPTLAAPPPEAASPLGRQAASPRGRQAAAPRVAGTAKTSQWRPRRLIGVLLGSLVCFSACAQAANNSQLRALQSSGPTAFLCLGAPGDPLADMARPLSECSRARTDTVDDYDIPHLYALVTQPITGEVAVVDLTTQENALIDQDPAIPGASFLPVGANPTDIISSPGGVATFVSSAEPNFEAIYALPSNMVRGSAPRLTSWPSCRLPAAPESMLMVLDAADANEEIRPSCDDSYGAEDTTAMCEGVEHCHGDLAGDADSVETPGRYKLAVTLPSAGGIAIIDAQALLDQEAGAAEDCRVERWLPLSVDLPAPLPQPPPNNSTACVDEPFTSEPFTPVFSATPGGMTLADDELFVADRSAPVIHRVQVSSPCEPVEGPPLLATSDEDPSRVVVSRRVSVSPLTLDLKRYLYAIDEVDGSIMMFDVSDDATTRRPLQRNNPASNPFQPPDRVRFQTPPRDIIIVRHDNDNVDGATGATLPVRCDPNADASAAAQAYRTNATFDDGAGPDTMRGVFAFAVLASGDVVTIDIEDYDADCRGPSDQTEALGCAPPLTTELTTSGEYSCNVIAPHQARAGVHLGYVDGVLNTRPSLATFPRLFDPEGSLLKLGGDIDFPRMRAPANAADVVVGPDLEPLAAGTVTAEPLEHALAMQLDDPRAHIIEESWSVTYEGALPGFGNRFAQFTNNDDGTLRLRELSSRFCTRGVLGADAFAGILASEGVPAADIPGRAESLADYVQIMSSLPAESNDYWSGASCQFSECQLAFGTVEAPTTSRDFRIEQASEDTLLLTPRTSQTEDVNCCFPGVVEFNVRVGSQWALTGSSVGFLHHVIADDEGHCRLSCDDQDQLLNGRVRPSGNDALSPTDPLLLRNPFFSFSISNGTAARDMRFSISTQRPFRPLNLSIVLNGSRDVQPVAIRYLSPTGELVISDGSLEGLTLVDLNEFSVVRQYN